MSAARSFPCGTRRVIATVASSLLLGACDASPLAPEPFAPEPCTMTPAFALPAGMERPSEAALKSALSDAADRLTLSFPEADRQDLQGALGQLSGGGAAASCRGMLVARDVLNRQPDTPETRPDRYAIWLIVELAIAAMTP